MSITLTVSELTARASELKAGERVLLSGTIYTARDAAHKRLSELLGQGKPLPFGLDGAVIYYCGPAPARPGAHIGPCGPTTSSRMDSFTPLLLSCGVKALIGKGRRSAAVKDALKKYGAVYLVATGGVAALMAEKVTSSELVAFEDLGPEAVYRLEVSGFPLIVANDAHGADIFENAKRGDD